MSYDGEPFEKPRWWWVLLVLGGLAITLTVFCCGCTEPPKPVLKTYTVKFVNPDGEVQRIETVQATSARKEIRWGGQMVVITYNYYKHHEGPFKNFLTPVGWDLILEKQ